MSVNLKDTQSRVHTHKTKQGVNTQGDDLYDVNIGNIPYVLPNDKSDEMAAVAHDSSVTVSKAVSHTKVSKKMTISE